MPAAGDIVAAGNDEADGSATSPDVRVEVVRGEEVEIALATQPGPAEWKSTPPNLAHRQRPGTRYPNSAAAGPGGTAQVE